MRSTLLAGLGVIALLAVLAVPAAAQSEPEYDRKTDNISFVAHEQFPQGTDMYFQRREGRQTLDGEVVDATKDYLFAGADASSAVGDPPEGTPEGVRVYDVTDPTSPVELAVIDCPGYHADVNVYENLLIQAIDSPASNQGCAAEIDPDGLNEEGKAGIRIYDVTDPANPVLQAFVNAETLENSVHNISTLTWAGKLYVAGSSFTPDSAPFNLSIVDLTQPDFPVTVVSMNEISPTATAECHDIGLDPKNKLAFCAAVTQTFIWDVSDPMAPTHVSIVGFPPPVETIHHAARLAPDGTTLVLNDELGGAAAAPGCFPTTQDPLGALWFYDISDPSAPQLMGTFSTSEAAPKNPCTSHFYNFIPGTSLLTIGWYKSGMIVVDYGDLPQTAEHAVFTPTGGDFWSSYYWHGYIYGNSFGGGGVYGGTNEAGGVWVTQLDGVGDVEPSLFDQGTSWSPWTSQLPAPDVAETEDTGGTTDSDDTTNLPSTGNGASALAVLAVTLAGVLLVRRRSRRDLPR